MLRIPFCFTMGRVKMKYPLRRKDGEPTYGQEACIYKVYAGDKFMIWKGRSFSQSISQAAETIERGLRIPIKPDNAFAGIVDLVVAHRLPFLEVEPISYPKSAFDLLREEQEMLWAAKSDPNCVNISFETYVPAWIPIGDLERFNEWKNSVTNKSNQ